MLFRIAGFLSAAIAALHIGIMIAGASAYRYFGAGEQMAEMAQRHSWYPTALTSLITLVFAIFSAYAFSAAGVIRKLPLLRTGVFIIGAIYTLRGLSLFPQLAYLARNGRPLLHRTPVFSAVSLTIGLVYLTAAVLLVRSTSAGPSSRAASSASADS